MPACPCTITCYPWGFLDMPKYTTLEKKATRAGFRDALLELGKKDPRIVALCADLTHSVYMHHFAEAFPERFFQMGIAEANMMGVAAGLSIVDQIPFTGTFANFSTGRVYDQIRQSIAYSNKNVKICASHAGLTLGEDGATHQILEDIGMMRMLPNMTVVCPCDYTQTKQATLAVAEHVGPLYLRFGRPAVPHFLPSSTRFVIGEALRLLEGKDVSVFATGHLTWEAICAEEILASEGISTEVINIHTIKPLDETAILESVRKTGCAVIAEEHQAAGGLGEAIARLLATHAPSPIAQVAVQNTFGESGKPEELMEKYHLTAYDIAASVRLLLKQS